MSLLENRVGSMARISGDGADWGTRVKSSRSRPVQCASFDVFLRPQRGERRKLSLIERPVVDPLRGRGEERNHDSNLRGPEKHFAECPAPGEFVPQKLEHGGPIQHKPPDHPH
jgi:hypothetical protein